MMPTSSPRGLKGIALLGRLFWWRLRHFASVSFRLLLRRWQALLFLFAPAMTPLLMQIQLLGKPVLWLLEPGDFQNSAGCWMLMLALAWSWSALQAEALKGGSAWQYLSLALPPRRAQWVDLAVLTVTDLPLLLPFAAAEFTLFEDANPQNLSAIAAVAALGIQLPVMQLLALRHQPSLFYCLFTDFIGLKAVAAGESPGLLALAISVGCLLGLAFPARAEAKISRNRTNPPLGLGLKAGWSPAWNMALIDMRHLLTGRQIAKHAGLLLCLALPVALHSLLMLTDLNQSVVVVLLSLTLLPLTLNTSGLSFELRRLHTPMSAYHAALGLAPACLRRIDLWVIQAIYLPLCLPLVTMLYLHTLSWRVLAVLPLGLLTIMACIRLNDWNVHQALIPKLLVTALACGSLSMGLLAG